MNKIYQNIIIKDKKIIKLINKIIILNNNYKIIRWLFKDRKCKHLKHLEFNHNFKNKLNNKILKNYFKK